MPRRSGIARRGAVIVVVASRGCAVVCPPLEYFATEGYLPRYKVSGRGTLVDWFFVAGEVANSQGVRPVKDYSLYRLTWP